MVIAWLRFVLRQIATALVVVTMFLLLSEILLPSSILPYFNLHVLVFITIFIALLSPTIEKKSRLRIIVIVPIFTLLLAYAALIFGTSASGLILLAALAIVLIGLTIALLSQGEYDEAILSPHVIPAEAGIQLSEVIIQETIIIEQQTDVFMR